jgi:hypothetical protein
LWKENEKSPQRDDLTVNKTKIVTGMTGKKVHYKVKTEDILSIT